MKVFNNYADREYAFNDPIKFCHIAPTRYLERFTKTNGAHLLLAHLVESDPKYRDYYANLDDGKYKILDNSAFEMFKQGREMYDSSKLVEMGNACKADCVVLSDYPKESSLKTISAAKNLIPKFKDAGFQTFFVPQSMPGDITDLLDAFEWALDKEDEIDVIGVSILACPIAMGIQDAHPNAYKLQRYLSRFSVMQRLEARGLLDGRAVKRFHFLGMTDGPREIELMKMYGYGEYIHTWDSSAAVWAGLHGIQFDSSPTGLLNGKFEEEVDFNYMSWSDPDFKTTGFSGTIPNYAPFATVQNNITYINEML